MLDDPAAMLKILFAISERRIAGDIAAGRRDVEQLVEDTYASFLESRKKNDPGTAAQYHHMEMVQAKVAFSQKNLPEEEKVCFAFMAANGIAEEAVYDAHHRGRLAELSRRMDEIQKREGFDDDEFWPVGERPADYQSLSNESDELYDKVHDAVLNTILRRYHLDDVAKLREENRGHFESLRKKGWKMIFGMPAKN